MVSETDFSRQPVGVFDSGVGGLSVLRELLHVLPQEDMVYLADTAWAPCACKQAEILRLS